MKDPEGFSFKTFEPPPDKKGIESLREAIEYLEKGLEKAKNNLVGAEHGGSTGIEGGGAEVQDGDRSTLLPAESEKDAEVIKVLEYHLGVFSANLYKLLGKEEPPK